ncbi:MAG: nuclear transport factor 2 family protein [Pseudobdellovibrionaceae bacterium]
MENTTIEEELIGLEKEYWQAMMDKDIDTMLSLSDDPCIVTGAQGFASIDKNSFAEMMNSSNYTLHNFEIDDDFQVRMLGQDTAVVAYKVREDLTVDNQPISFEASDASTWVRRNGKWVCALHTESILGDPFGRDRVQSAKGM